MSFSSEVKDELTQHIASARHCQIAELTALLLTAGENDSAGIHLKTENYRVAHKAGLLIHRLFGIACQVRIRTYMEHSSATVYDLFVSEKEQAERICQACKLETDKGLDRLVVQKTCCKRAFLRGIFLTSGSVNNPEKSYHFEIACDTLKMAETIQEIMKSFELDARIVKRKKSQVVYLKEGAMIVDALNVMEAHRALMNMENVRILKDVRNQTNRKVNCDLANINKTLTAAGRQLEDIRYIERRKGFSDLSEGLRQVAELRLQEPEVSLKELGEMLDPPVSKSGVNHRLKKLSELAESLREADGVGNG